MIRRHIAAFLCAAACASAAHADRPVGVDVETGWVWSPRNVVRSPGDSGTWFALNRLTGQGAFGPAVRLQVFVPISDDREVRLLYAPLTLSGSGVPDAPIRFAGSDFAAGAPTDARYAFNSYRATLRRRFVRDARTEAWAGFTLKVRDAGVWLRQGSTAARDTNVGLVPLIHAAGRHRLTSRLSLQGDIDALAAPQGRAVDLGLRLTYDLPDGTTVGAGWRTIEGGADNDRVFTFAWLNLAVFSVAKRF